MTFRELLEAGGQTSGKLEIESLSLQKAKKYTEREFQKNNMSLSEIPNFDKNFTIAKKLCSIGKTSRKDMPVIVTKDVKLFQKRLQDGDLDIRFKYKAPSTNINDPFPENLSGKQAEKWLTAGMEKSDKNKDDDKVQVQLKKITAKNLNPIQKQIYFDKAIEKITSNGIKQMKNILSKSILIASKDGYIIDGHHRFLVALLINPDIKLNVLSINLPIKTLLPLAVAYGDAIGNKRNL